MLVCVCVRVRVLGIVSYSSLYQKEFVLYKYINFYYYGCEG